MVPVAAYPDLAISVADVEGIAAHLLERLGQAFLKAIYCSEHAYKGCDAYGDNRTGDHGPEHIVTDGAKGDLDVLQSVQRMIGEQIKDKNTALKQLFYKRWILRD